MHSVSNGNPHVWILSHFAFCFKNCFFIVSFLYNALHTMPSINSPDYSFVLLAAFFILFFTLAFVSSLLSPRRSALAKAQVYAALLS